MSVHSLRSGLLVSLLVVPQAFAGRSKMVELKNVPKTAKSVADNLAKEKKDPNRRSLAVALDEMLRAAPEVQDQAVYDQLAGLLLNDVFDRMGEPSDVFTTEYGPDKYGPRADIMIRESSKIRPGRVSKNFARNYIKKLQGKKIDPVYRGQMARFGMTVAENDAEFTKWTDTKGWGVVFHAGHLDPSGIARIGVTFVSPGTPEDPGGKFEQPSWIGFYSQQKPGVPFQALYVASATATDSREQLVNILPPKVEPTDPVRKLAVAVWMEMVRALPLREKFTDEEQEIFDVTLDELEVPVGLIEAYRDSDSAMVRAAATAKAVKMGGALNPNSVFLISRSLRHPAARARMEELLKKAPQGWAPPPLPQGFREEPLYVAPDAGTPKAADAGVRADGGK